VKLQSNNKGISYVRQEYDALDWDKKDWRRVASVGDNARFSVN